MKKVIYIHNNYEPAQITKNPDKEDRFYTYGFGSSLARNFKKYNPEFEVEMWRVDGFTDGYYEKIVQEVKHRIFPSVYINHLGDFSLKFIRELRRELKKNKALLFVSHVHSWLTYQVAFFFGKKYPVTCSHHGDWSPFFRIKKRKGVRYIKDFIDIRIEKLLLKRIKYFFVGDTFQIPYLKKALPDLNYMIFSSGLDVNKMVPIPKDEARKKLGWKNDKKYILYVGKLYELKQSRELIDIYKEIKEERPEIELVVIGNTQDDEYYNYAVESGAIVLGRILNSELNMYYSAADVYILLALRDDYFGGTGIAPLESLACNTPIISYSMRNYVGDNIQELGEVPDTLDRYKKAIIKVLDNPGNYKNMRESIIKHYTHEVITGRISAVFEMLMAQYNIN